MPELEHSPEYDPNESKRNALEQGSGASTFVSRIRTTDELPPISEDLVTVSTKPRYSRRGGRSLPEISGRDVGRDLDPPWVPADQERKDRAHSRAEEASISINRGIAAKTYAETTKFTGGKAAHNLALVAARQAKHERGNP